METVWCLFESIDEEDEKPIGIFATSASGMEALRARAAEIEEERNKEFVDLGSNRLGGLDELGSSRLFLDASVYKAVTLTLECRIIKP